ncbi:MAG: transcriptional regulator [Candidatus Aminicenantes bacterium]|nr:MAG: transcriptional regulator [Candidatus Aminicenantes bacterium]
MTLQKIKELLQAEVIFGDHYLDREITFAGGSDLMSDVLAFGQPGILLLTGLTNLQSVRTADIIEAKAIIYVRGKKPDDQTIQFAREKNIPILSTPLMMYEACGILYQAGLPGVGSLRQATTSDE